MSDDGARMGGGEGDEEIVGCVSRELNQCGLSETLSLCPGGQLGEE